MHKMWLRSANDSVYPGEKYGELLQRSSFAAMSHVSGIISLGAFEGRDMGKKEQSEAV
ncbi:MAG: hypothetical protein WA125_14110 [Desulfosporosinus sp.]